MTEHSFKPDGDGFLPTEWAVGPWSADTLQASAYGALLARLLERSEAASGMVVARLSYDLWRPVTRERLTSTITTLREGRKARTVEVALQQAGKPVARCTAVLLNGDGRTPPVASERAAPPLGPDHGRPVPPQVKAWSPFFTGVDTRVVEGDLLKAGPAAAWFHLVRPLVEGEV